MISTAWLLAGALLTVAMFYTNKHAEKNQIQKQWTDSYGILRTRQEWRIERVIQMTCLVVSWIISWLWHAIHTMSWGMFFGQILVLCGTIVILSLPIHQTVSSIIKKLQLRLQGQSTINKDVIKQYRIIKGLLPGRGPIRSQVAKIVDDALPELEDRANNIGLRIERVGTLIDRGRKRESDVARQERVLKSLQRRHHEILQRHSECLGFLDTVEALLLDTTDGDLPDVSDDFERLMHSIEEDRVQRQAAEAEAKSVSARSGRSYTHA